MAAILVIKTHLILYQPCRGDQFKADRLWLGMSHSLLSCMDHTRWDLMEVRNIMHSPWPAHISILPLKMNPPPFDHDLWNKSPDNFTMIPVDYAECHKKMALQCIWILSGMSYVQGDVLSYAKFQWINHILNAPPSDEILQCLLDNVSLLNREDASRALKWAEVR